MTPRARHDVSESDIQLMTAVCLGAPRAWAIFLRRFRGLIVSCVSRTLVRSGVAADSMHIDDAFGDVLLAMVTNDYRRLRQYREERGCAPSSWIGLIAVSATLDYVRREKRQRSSPVEMEELERHAQWVPGPDYAFERRERLERVNSALTKCTKRDREFAQLYFVEGLAPVEVARRSGVEVATVYSRRVKLERRLTTMLAIAS